MSRKVLINCKKGEKELYDQIFKSRYFRDSGASEFDYALIFTLAVAYGFNEKNFEPLKGGTEWVTRREYIRKNDDLMIFLRSIVIAKTEDISIINNDDKIFEIAESFANGGIHRLHHALLDKNSPNFDKILEGLLNEGKN